MIHTEDISDDELIQIFKINKCSLKKLELIFNKKKNWAEREFRKRNINYHKIKEEYYYIERYCKFCGKKLDLSIDKRKLFCSHSCAAAYNNKLRNVEKEVNHCIVCGKQTINSKFCGLECIKKYNYDMYISDWKEGKESGTIRKYGISNRIRKYLFDKYNSSCQCYGWNKINPVTKKDTFVDSSYRWKLS